MSLKPTPGRIESYTWAIMAVDEDGATIGTDEGPKSTISDRATPSESCDKFVISLLRTVRSVFTAGKAKTLKMEILLLI